MVDIARAIGGIFAGSGALLLIYLGHTDIGSVILSAMLAFFVGEANGQRKAGP